MLEWVGGDFDPEEAVKIHTEIKSKKSIGIHWGTFNLTFEVCLY
jgi:N-acyl-phosphatidylethanolamine-hydrolysing phospholipase D